MDIDEAKAVVRALRRGPRKVVRGGGLPALRLVPDYVERTDMVWSVGIQVGRSKRIVKRIGADAGSVQWWCS